MERVKWTMLNLHVWTGSIDALLTTLITPYVFFPVFCGFPVGILAVFEVSTKLQFIIGQCLIGGLIVSFIMMFENRHSSLVRSKVKIPNSSFRIIYFTVNYLYSFGYLLPVYLLLDELDQLEAKLTILKTVLPCPTPEFFDSHVYVLIMDGKPVIIYWMIFMCISLSQMTFFLFHSIFHLFYLSPNLSDKTKEMQKKFLISVCIQVAVPIAVLIIPTVCGLLAMYFNYYNQAMTNFTVLCISFHGMSATIVLIYLNEPYRTFTIGLLKKRKVTSTKSSIQERRKSTVFATSNEQTVVF